MHTTDFWPFSVWFSKAHSSETTLLKVYNGVLMASDAGNCFLLILPDLSDSFESVDHSILLNRLKILAGISGSALDCFFSYLSGITFSVQVSRFSSYVEENQSQEWVPILVTLLPFIQFSGIYYNFYADNIQLYGATGWMGCPLKLIVY